MTAAVHDLTRKRPLLLLNRAVAKAELLIEEVDQMFAEERRRREDEGIDPRAVVILNIFRDQYADCPRVVREIDYVKGLLRGRQ
jgi:hypothetical protein